MALPKFVVIKSASNKTYLQLPYGKNTFLKFKGYKHEVVEAKSEAGLVHIKCCETGKYWTLAGMHSNIIAAEADKPVEDGTSAACTLIKPTLKYVGGVTVVNFQFQRQSKWQSVFINSMGCLESGENMADDFIVSDWEKLRRPHPNKSTGTPTGGDAMVEGIEIEDGVFIGGVEARGPGHLSVFGSSFGGGSSAEDGISVADGNIQPFDVPVGGTSTLRKRTIKGGFKTGVSVAGAGVGAYIHGVEDIGRSSKTSDFIVSDWEKLQRPHPNKSTGTPTGGNAMVEGIEIEDGVFIAGVEARGPGHLSVFSTSFGGGSSAGDGLSVADVNIKPCDVPVGGTFTFGKRTIKGGLKIGYPPIEEGVRTIKAGFGGGLSARDGVSVARAGVGTYIHGVEDIGRSSKGMDTSDGGRGVGGESGGAGASAGAAASEGVGSGVQASEGADVGAEGEEAEGMGGAPYIQELEEIGRSSKGMDTSDGDRGNTATSDALGNYSTDWKDQERVLIQYDVLYKAALTADWDTAAIFLGQEPDAVFQPITGRLETALIVAVRSAKRNHFVKMVMEKMQREGVALIAQQDILGATALHAAVDGGNIEASVWLVQKNSELANIGDKDGTLAVHVAADFGNREMVDILLQHTTKLSDTESGLKLLPSCILWLLVDFTTLL